MVRPRDIARRPRVLAALLMLGSAVAAQTVTERAEGLRDNTPRWHAITCARRAVDNVARVMKDGVIVADGDPMQTATRTERLFMQGSELGPGNPQTRLTDKDRQTHLQAVPR